MESPRHELDRNLPNFSVSQVKQAVYRLYHIDGEFIQQNAERDLSFRVQSDTGVDYVVKIASIVDSRGIIDMQNSALKHVSKMDGKLPVPAIIDSVNGNDIEWISDDAGNRHMLRVLSYLPGEVLNSGKLNDPARTYYNLGATMARLDLALRNFFHGEANNNRHLWDLGHCLQLRDSTHYIADAEIRNLCDEILDNAETEVFPRLARTRHQVIHQDAHAGNVLINPDDHSEITGIIDFGDMLFGSIVCEIVPIADGYEEEDDHLQILCDICAGYDSVIALEDNEIDLVYDMALLRIVINVIIICARDALLKEGETVNIENTGHFERILKKLLKIGRAQATQQLRRACRFPVYTAADNTAACHADNQQTLISKRQRNLGRLGHFYRKPLNFTRGKGAWLYTADGTAYLDTYNNVPQIGHSHPHVVRAISRQAAALNTNTRYMCDIVADYAERLTSSLPAHLDTCVFVNSGSEANDFAMQFAKFATGNSGALVMHNAYHGCTETSGHLSPESYDPVDHVECLQVPDMYRGPFRDEDDAAERYAADTDRAISALAERGHRPAAFIVDTALCSNGVPAPPESYFDRVARKVRQAGGLVIADEVQAGLGRLGQFWGFQAVGLEHVDMVTMGKPVANGHPLGVVILNHDLHERVYRHNTIFSTFGGNTVSCAAGMAVLDVIEREKLIDKGNRVGNYFREQLRKLAERQSLIGDVRGRGMLIGLEFVTDRETRAPATEQTAELLEVMKDNQVLIGSEGPFKNILKMRPSFAWTESEVDIFIDALDRSLSAIVKI